MMAPLRTVVTLQRFNSVSWSMMALLRTVTLQRLYSVSWSMMAPLRTVTLQRFNSVSWSMMALLRTVTLQRLYSVSWSMMTPLRTVILKMFNLFSWSMMALLRTVTLQRINSYYRRLLVVTLISNAEWSKNSSSPEKEIDSRRFIQSSLPCLIRLFRSVNVCKDVSAVWLAIRRRCSDLKVTIVFNPFLDVHYHINYIK